MKLDEEVKKDALEDLQQGVENAIEEMPNGLTNDEMRNAILTGARSQGIKGLRLS